MKTIIRACSASRLSILPQGILCFCLVHLGAVASMSFLLVLNETSTAQAQDSSLFHNPVLQQRALPAQRPTPGSAVESLPAPTVGTRPDALDTGSPSLRPPMNAGQSAQQTGFPPVAGYGTVNPASYLAYPTYTHQPQPPQRVLRLHDIVQIRVEEMARMIAEGNAQQRKTGLYDAVLEEWLKLDGLNLNAAMQEGEDPAVRGQTNQIFRANSQLLTRESLTFNIAAEIIDIYPNGNIVLQARKTINVNDNRWEISLGGICRDTAIGPDNVVLSRDIVDLKIDKREAGQARDGYKRGWFAEFLGRFQPF